MLYPPIPLKFWTPFLIEIFRHNNTIENVLLDGNGLTHDLIEAIRLICDRNSTNHQLQEKTKIQTSFLLQELENTKTQALDQSARFENEIDISRQEKIQLEANLWANKSKYRGYHIRLLGHWLTHIRLQHLVFGFNHIRV